MKQMEISSKIVRWKAGTNKPSEYFPKKKMLRTIMLVWMIPFHFITYLIHLRGLW